MSSQINEGISIHHSGSQQSLRLLELPHELVDLVTSAHAPRLLLKATKPAKHEQSSYATLCTPHSTYEIRQVQTSNSLFVLEQRGRGLVTCSTCTSTLEVGSLVDDEISLDLLSSLMRKALPVYDGAMTKNNISTAVQISKMNIFEDIPYSTEQCEQAWHRIVALEYQGICWRPSPAVLMEMWTGLLESAALNEIDIVAGFDSDLLWNVSNETNPRQLYDALFGAVATVNKNTRRTTIVLDRRKTCLWLLDNLRDHESIGTREQQHQFILQSWTSLLPEAWREDACRKEVQKACLRWRLDTAKSSGTLSSESIEQIVSIKRPAKSRNWHERLKKGRKAF